jgi:hypothetical protein
MLLSITFCETRTERSVEVYRGKNFDSPQTVADTIDLHYSSYFVFYNINPTGIALAAFTTFISC